MSQPEARCPRCGAATERLQEYCLDCGLRLRSPGLVPALASGWRRRLRWYPGDWVWPSLLALVVAAVAGAGAIWWTRDAESAAATTVVGDTSQLPTVATTAAVPTTAPTPTVRTQTTATAPRRRRTARRTLIEWPKARSGWTLVLASYPTSGGRQAALTKAREALRAGLTKVGVIESSRYASLHPGYYVVFSGIYPTIAAAQDSVAAAAEAGYGNAYARRVTR